MIGTKFAPSSSYAWVRVNANTQIGIQAPTLIAPAPGFLSTVGVLARRVNGTPSVYLAVYQAGGNGAPTERFARTAKIAVSSASSGANAEGALVDADPTRFGGGTGNQSVRFAAGEGMVLALRVEGGDIELAIDPNGLGGATHHFRTVASGYPTDPFIPSSSATANLVAIYGEFQPSAAPSAPGSLVPAAGAAITGTTPTFTGTFVDADTIAPYRDHLREYRIEVRQQGTTALLWGDAAATFSATDAERTAAAFSQVYNGVALVAGPTYEWRASVADDTLTSGPWSAWRSFVINGTGAVVVSTGTPTGKVDTDPSLIDWTGVWTHPNTGRNADRVQVRVLDDGVVVKLGAVVTKTVTWNALGTSFTIGRTEDGFAPLTPGSYTFQLRARDAVATVWSPWSADRAFTVNSPPSTPANLQPPTGASSTSRPLLEWSSRDPDPDDVEGVDVDWTVQIKSPSGTVTTYSGITTYDAARGVASLQTTATHVPSTQRGWQWRVQARDISAFDGLSGWSTWQTFDYVSGPVVAITGPVPDNVVLATPTPNVLWTVTGATQVSRQVTVYRQDVSKALWASARQDRTQTDYQIPAGVLKNTGAYDVVVDVWDASNTKGTSLRRQFSVLVTPPIPLVNVTASPYTYEGEGEPTSALITWDRSTYPPGEFAGYVVTRRRAGQDPDEAVRLRTIANIEHTRWVDDRLPAASNWVYAVTQLRSVGGDTLESDPVEDRIQLDISGVVLVSVYDGTKRAVLRWGLVGSMPTVSPSIERDEATYQTWGSKAKSVVMRTPGTRMTVSLSGFRFLDAPESRRERMFDALMELYETGDPVCYRDRRRRFFASMGPPSWDEGRNSDTVSLDLSEVAFDEGETAE